ncbi:hypothetical protein VSDG_04811 [Cytospora chrysosperma]|uniref:Uncharacterized protein n=1 Tax=Cytospora chrysosperma TaxID=252740 RepID=A0A423W201_CYTCH|nr:hypothetical protein VSDG_04811 [Valsa sordida]
MANGYGYGLDRFERLFSKRKHAPSRNTTVSNINGSAPSASAQSDPPSPDPPIFPQAPFIRPKTNASRMHARDELLFSSSRSSTGLTSSSGSRTCSWRLSGSDSQAMSDRRRQSGYSSTASFHIPSRSSSLLARRHDRKPGGLVHLNIPGETTTIIRPSPYLLPRSSSTGPSPPALGDTKRAQRCLLEALPIYPAQRYETPPPSDQDEINFSIPPSTRGRLPPAAVSHFTPEHSPDMIPRRDSIFSEPKTSSDLKRSSFSVPAPTCRRATSIASSAALLNDDWRDSYVPLDAAVVETSPETNTIIQELPVQDFMTLTDEDIAEVKIKAPSEPPARLPPPPPVLPPNPRSPPFLPTRRISTMLPPPLAPDEVAAFQAARIAKKYDFDFLYVVNFWPGQMGHLHRPGGGPRVQCHSHSHSSSTVSSATSSSSRPPSTLYSPTSDCPTTKNSTPRNSLQLQAAPLERGGDGNGDSGDGAYHMGECCPYPPPPGTITTGNGPSRPGAITGRLLTGYGLNTLEAPFRLSARAHRKILREGADGWVEYRKSDARDNEFARGYARSFYTAGPSQAHMPPPLPPWRGIVFAAYRRPRGHGGTVHSSKAELDALEREAETLVELLLDFHQGRRRWELYQEAVRSSG